MEDSKRVNCPDPVCDSGFISVPENAVVGDILECPECGAEVEVISLNPVEVGLLLEEK